MTIYRVAERFKSVQGEGLFTGTPMAFVRFVGCSVGKKICASCDTMFDQEYPWQGGGVFTAEQLFDWAAPFKHICLTGGEPLDQDLLPLLSTASKERVFHIETSGTVFPSWISSDQDYQHDPFVHICVSPKPGWRQGMIAVADEVKVIVPGLGPGDEWPGLSEALTWARSGKLVYIQPRNLRSEIDKVNLAMVLTVVQEHPELRLSVQLHKYIHVS